MLRRKLLIILGPVVLLLMATAVLAIVMLQGVLRELSHIDTEAWLAVEQVNDLSITVNAIEVHLYEIKTGQEHHLDALIQSTEYAGKLLDEMSEQYVIQGEPSRVHFERLKKLLPHFVAHITQLATAPDSDAQRLSLRDTLADAVELRSETLPISRAVREHAQKEQDDLLTHFRWVVLGMGIAFLVVINVAVIVLLRMGAMILRPVDKLVAASRALAEERFNYRVKLDGGDEFGELGEAFNRLAGRLQANEQRRMEMLGQIAVTLNHELNNAITIIELQLRTLARQAGQDAQFAKCLRQIHDNLERMTRTVESLKHVRRIVLTDYVAGTKMLDLEQSVREDVQEPSAGKVS